MAAINTAAIVGRITHDLKLNATNSGKMVLSFALAAEKSSEKDVEDISIDEPIDLSEIPF